MNLLTKVTGIAPPDGSPSSLAGGPGAPLGELTSSALDMLRSVGIVVGYLAGRYDDDRARPGSGD